MARTKPESLDWALWFYWIMATTMGWIVGSIFFKGLPIIASGIAISTLQGFVLYKRIQKVWRWVILGSLGWIIGYSIYVIFLFDNMGILSGLVIGGTVGFVQWLLLKTELDWAGWWIIINILAWTTGLTLIPGLFSSGALPGALTGFTLVIIFRFSSYETE